MRVKVLVHIKLFFYLYTHILTFALLNVTQSCPCVLWKLNIFIVVAAEWKMCVYFPSVFLEKRRKLKAKVWKKNTGKIIMTTIWFLLLSLNIYRKKIYKTYYSITIRYILTHLCSNIGPWLPIQHSYLNNGHFLLISIFWLYSVFLFTFHIHTNITPTQRYFLSIQLTKNT